jgi:DNA-binding GntR family transcriptional regulator
MAAEAVSETPPDGTRPREKAYDRFKRQLLSGALQPGEMVSLRELVRRLDLPLAAVREALSRLEGEGLVRVFAQRGIQVCSVDVTFMREAFQLRMILELEGIRALAEHGEDAPLAALEQRFLALRAQLGAPLPPEAVAEAISLDLALHDRIIAALANAMVTTLYGQVRDRLMMVRRATLLPPGGLVHDTTEEHLLILAALRRRDAEDAALALRVHLAQSMRRQMGIR